MMLSYLLRILRVNQRWISIGAAYVVISTTYCSAAEYKIAFNRDIRPLLSDRCFHCHGPDEKERKEKLRLDLSEGPEGPFAVRPDGSVPIKPGDLTNSEVWQRIITDDADDVMPPADSHKKALSPKEKALFKQWIEEGAEYQGFWAFEPPKKEKPPRSGRKWSKDPIDLFIFDQLKKHTLTVSAGATKRTLIRRVTFDLTGLPPTLEELHAFLEDNSKQAYTKNRRPPNRKKNNTANTWPGIGWILSDSQTQTVNTKIFTATSSLIATG